jgi:dedicator of cytokinesis protein 3
MAGGERPEPIKKCFESLEYIFKLIIQSRRLFSNATGGQFEDSFRRDLQMVFVSLSNMLSLEANENVLPTQIELLNSLAVVFEQLIDTLPADELASSIKNMLDSIPSGTREYQSPLIQAKLKAVKNLVSGKLFHNSPTRPHILSIASSILQVHLNKRDDISMCSEIMCEILIQLHKLRSEGNEKEMAILDQNLDELCQSTLYTLIETVNILFDRKTEPCDLLACMLGLLQQLGESHYRNLWNSLLLNGDSKVLRDFLHRSLKIFEKLLSHNWEIFQKDWLMMKLSANDVIKKSMEEFAKQLVYRFLDPVYFDSGLWMTYFELAVTYLTQPCLQLEHYHEGKRRKILKEFGDMRVSMGLQILSMWSQLGDHKSHFIVSMVGSFLVSIWRFLFQRIYVRINFLRNLLA